MPDYENDKSAAQLEREVELQRSRVSSTIDEIQDQLSPGQLIDQFMSMGKGGAGEFTRNLGRTVTANPLPVALMGASLLWLMSGKGQPKMHSSSHHRPAGYRYGDSDALRGQHYGGNGHGSAGDKAKELGSGVAGKVSGAADGVKDFGSGVAGKVSGAASDAKDAMGHALDEAGHRYEEAREGLDRTFHDARDGAKRVGDNLMHMLEEQPLVAGALAFAVGAAIGAIAPRTRQEDELMGETSDKLKHAVQETAEPLLEEGKHALDDGKAKLEESKAKLDKSLDEFKHKAASGFGSESSSAQPSTPGTAGTSGTPGTPGTH